jgi:hypothetical protein
MLLLIMLLALVVVAGVAWQFTMGPQQPLGLDALRQALTSLPEPFATLCWVLVAVLGMLVVVRLCLWVLREIREGL